MKFVEHIPTLISGVAAFLLGYAVASHSIKPIQLEHTVRVVTTNAPVRVEVESTVAPDSIPFDTTKFRVLTDGTRFKCQRDRGYGWVDDIFGGYFATAEAARAHNEQQREFWRNADREFDAQKNFKVVAQ